MLRHRVGWLFFQPAHFYYSVIIGTGKGPHLCGMHPRHLSIDQFTYTLPNDRVAQYPLDERDQSKLLVFRQGQIADQQFSALPSQLPAGSTLVFNNTRVVEARMVFHKPSGGAIEVFALEPVQGDITTAMQTTGSLEYCCLVGGANKWKPGLVLQKKLDYAGKIVLLEAAMVQRGSGHFIIRFSWSPQELPFAILLHLAGHIPIPPYLQRQAEASDSERYQTVYARHEGSVAAPTAGLHFTPQVLQQLQNQGTNALYTTLHVGAGTFMPVKSAHMEGHDMHAEWLETDLDFLHALRGASCVIAVGTTSMRTLESLYWMGVKAWHNPAMAMENLEMQQWEVYDIWQTKAIPAADAIGALISWLQARGHSRLAIKTSILIAPGYQFGICRGIVTNFHQPASTLLLLVAALIGPAWKQVYEHALQHNYRFLSYGDSSLLLP